MAMADMRQHFQSPYCLSRSGKPDWYKMTKIDKLFWCIPKLPNII